MAKPVSVISTSDSTGVAALIALLRSQRKLTIEERTALQRASFRQAFEAMRANPGLTYGQAIGAPGMVSSTPDYGEFKRALHAIDSDLKEQLRIVSEGVLEYSRHGVIPPPYYAWRVAILLRKLHCYDAEAEFCEAFTALFGDGNGARYGDIAARVPKARALAAKLLRKAMGERTLDPDL